jgi:exosortase C (VPDSG-CTERM-specific)
MTRKSFRVGELIFIAVSLLALFSVPLWELMRLCLSDDLYSYIPLIPLVCAFLIWIDRGKLPNEVVPSRRASLLPLATGLVVLAAYALARSGGWRPEITDYLAVMVVALILFLVAGCLFSLGWPFLRAASFPALFLLFAIPIPSGMRDGIETFLQHKSADAADMFFSLSGMPVFRQGLIFQLPGFTFQVAPECSGIHSTWVLFILSFLAAYLFLRTPWRRAALVLAVLPLALLRNGFRIWVVGELCVHISPDMINSYIHRHGGPIFFVLSLVPFGLFLAVLQKTEHLKVDHGAVERAVSTETPL